MAYRSTPIEQTYPSLAARKLRSAARKEREALIQRAEAADLQRRWEEYRLRQSAEVEVEAMSA